MDDDERKKHSEFLRAVSENQRKNYDRFLGPRCVDCDTPIFYCWLWKGDTGSHEFSDGFRIRMRCPNPECGSSREYEPMAFEEFPWSDEVQ